MQDFNRYNYTIKENDLLRVLREAASYGCNPTIIINGEYYNVEMESVPSAPSADPEDIF